MTQETVFACDAMGDLYQYNEQLLWANKELLARCDLLEAEKTKLKETLRFIYEECDWSENIFNNGGGDDRIGDACRAALAGEG